MSHNLSKLPIFSTAVLIWGNYEIYRIYNGTHPYWSPRLAAKGYIGAKDDAGKDSNRDANVEAGDASPRSFTTFKWQTLPNGVPVPTFGLQRPFGKE